jgi:DNA polymerase III delta prime subunit
VNLNAEWITGFVDGEGCFHVGISRHEGMSVGVQILPEFTVVQHERDVQLLHAIKAYFGCGVVRKNHGDRMAYRVRERKQLNERIVPFFAEHPLRSKKRVDFEKFRDVLLLMEKDEHLTEGGVEKIRRIAEQMNRGSQDRVQPARKLVGEN